MESLSVAIKRDVQHEMCEKKDVRLMTFSER